MNKLLRFSFMLLLMMVCGIFRASAGNVGTAWQEQIFKQNTPVAIPLNIETEGVKLTSVGRDFMGNTINVNYNLYEEGELDWASGTKLVFTAKDNITGIVIDGQFKEFAEADKGTYVNGAWKGELEAGQVLTLTSNDGINVHSITILYNGAQLELEDIEEEEVVINLDITKTDWSTIGKANGEKIGTASSNSDKIDHYTFEIYCEEDPSIFVTFAESTGDIVTYDPQDLYNGYHYTLVVKAYDTPQYGAKPVATAEYQFVGTGKAATVYNNEIEVVKVGLKKNTQGLGYNLNGLSFDITFSAPVASVKAWWAKGFEGSTNFTATKKSDDGTVWTITMTESVLSAEGAINVNITAKDSEGHQLAIACDNSPYGFDVVVSPEEEEETPATLTIGAVVIELSETEPIKLAAYPAGAVIAVPIDDEAVKKVTYEVVDKTANEVLKSQADLTKGEDGIWRAEMPKKYDLAAGHQYAIHVVARDGMSSFTSKVLYEYNYLIDGTANVAVYSNVKVVSITPNENQTITDPEQVITISFSEAIASLKVVAVLAQMSSVDVDKANITTEDNITWSVKMAKSYFSNGALSLNFYAVDKQGNRVTDEQSGVGTPENCYVNYGWASTLGLPTPALAEDGKELDVLEKLTFKYDGIGLNQDKTTATWKNIVIEKDGVALDLTVAESQFEVQGEDAGNAMVWTLPEPLYKGVYTIKVPACAFMLGHDISNFYSGECEFTVTVTGEAPVAEPEIVLNITKTNWSKIGSESGEAIGTAELKGGDAFDHIEAEIRCQEDPDQYITFANLRTNGGNLMCYAWEGGSYTLNKGYHYTLIVRAFDVPYYGVEPIAVATYEFVGTGAEAIVYSDIELTKVDLPENDLLYHGYDLKVTSFDVTFSAPVSKVKVWGAMGMDGSINYSAAKKSEDGTVWTILLNEDILNEEGSVNLMIQAWDAAGVQAKGWNGDHAFDMNLIVNLDDDAIRSIEMASAGKEIVTLSGMRVKASQMKKGQIYIINGKKVMVK